jgi:hypothetical protein
MKIIQLNIDIHVGIRKSSFDLLKRNRITVHGRKKTSDCRSSWLMRVLDLKCYLHT